MLFATWYMEKAANNADNSPSPGRKNRLKSPARSQGPTRDNPDRRLVKCVNGMGPDSDSDESLDEETVSIKDK